MTNLNLITSDLNEITDNKSKSNQSQKGKKSDENSNVKDFYQ